MRAWSNPACLRPDRAKSRGASPCRWSLSASWHHVFTAQTWCARSPYCAKMVTSGRSVRDRFSARNAASDSCAAPVPGIRSTAIVAPPAVTTRPEPGVFTSAERSQNPGSVTLPRATAVLPKACSPTGFGGASAAAFCAAVVVSSAAAVRALAGGGLMPSELGRGPVAATGSIARVPSPKGRLAQADKSKTGKSKTGKSAKACFIAKR